MNDRLISLSAGVFSILNTIQFLIFDLNEVMFLGYEDRVQLYLDTRSGVASWTLNNKKTISVILSVITIIVSAAYLYCLRRNKIVGLLCYALWTIIYELTSFTMTLLTSKMIHKDFKALGDIHLVLQISRMLLHFLFLPFVIKYIYSLYKELQSFSKTKRRRHSSISLIDSWASLGPGMTHRKST